MKKIIILLVAFFATIAVFAQSKNYTALSKDRNGIYHEVIFNPDSKAFPYHGDENDIFSFEKVAVPQPALSGYIFLKKDIPDSVFDYFPIITLYIRTKDGMWEKGPGFRAVPTLTYCCGILHAKVVEPGNQEEKTYEISSVTIPYNDGERVIWTRVLVKN